MKKSEIAQARAESLRPTMRCREVVLMQTRYEEMIPPARYIKKEASARRPIGAFEKISLRLLNACNHIQTMPFASIAPAM